MLQNPKHQCSYILSITLSIYIYIFFFSHEHILSKFKDIFNTSKINLLSIETWEKFYLFISFKAIYTRPNEIETKNFGTHPGSLTEV